MEEKELRIQVPEGYEIDTENSTFECIKFKKKKSLDYFEILNSYDIETTSLLTPYANNKYLKKLNAINKLMLVAKYLNDGWIPDFENADISKYYLYVYENKVIISSTYVTSIAIVYFKSKELAQQAIDILGEELIKIIFEDEY